MVDDKDIIKKALENNCDVFEYELMKKRTTFRIGGKVRAFIVVKSEIALIEIIKICNEKVYPYFIIGKGSNLLVNDNDHELIVLKLSGDFEKINLIDEKTISCGAGVDLSKLCTFALENSLSGLEFAWGIPGSVGGAVYMNAGAYGGEMSDILHKSFHLNKKLEKEYYDKENMQLSYRHSAYCENSFVITQAILKLQKGNKEEIKSKMDDFIKRRKDKQPLNYPSAGSVFKRPAGNFAGTLVEKSGLKGYSIGGATVSEKHAGFIVNKDNATFNDVESLINHIKNVVEEKHGIKLESEIKFI